MNNQTDPRYPIAQFTWPATITPDQLHPLFLQVANHRIDQPQ